MKLVAAGLMVMMMTVPVGQWTTVRMDGAMAAFSTDGEIAEATALDGVITVYGRAAGRTTVVVESADGVRELEVVVGEGEQRRGDDVHTATIELSSGRKSVAYSVIDGLAMVEGDIVLGAANELEAREVSAQATAITGAKFQWANGVIPYTIDAALPDQTRVTEAISHWEAKTNWRFMRRTAERDFVTFRPGTGCGSSVGRRGGQQFVTLGGDCGKGNAIHEIGHAVGLWHEQSREDRDQFVRINVAKVRQDSLHNFNQHITDGDDVGPYDYASIMHYPRNAYSVDGSDTVVPIDAKARIGQRDGLSAGDIAAANALCVKTGKRRAIG